MKTQGNNTTKANTKHNEKPNKGITNRKESQRKGRTSGCEAPGQNEQTRNIYNIKPTNKKHIYDKTYKP